MLTQPKSSQHIFEGFGEKSVEVSANQIFEYGHRLKENINTLPANPFSSILRNKWDCNNRLSLPNILPVVDKNTKISLDQPIQFESGEGDQENENEANFKPINFMFTLNKEELPMPMEWNNAIPW